MQPGFASRCRPATASGCRSAGRVSRACPRRRSRSRFAGTCAHLLLGLLLACTAARAEPGVTPTPCPDHATAVEPGVSIQAAVDAAGEGAAFCLKNGEYRMQAIRPRRGQSFFGEG